MAMSLAASMATTSARAQRLHLDVSVSGEFATSRGGGFLLTLTLGPMFEVSPSFLVGFSAGALVGFSDESSVQAAFIGLPVDVVGRARFGPVYIDASIGPWFVAGAGSGVVLHFGGSLGAQLGVFRIGVTASSVNGFFVIGPVLGVTL